ncbi:phosphate ABC transporter phosphate-binding protein [Actinoplanes tereljensis]|uniref:Phosphate ABC transporter substrate-binding protein PstS n=1 Tax=Paractinoplanes tereljensis TaxID=571912 RepID=A0A919TYC3_9ACTN|nr:phosphate ABC transporter substrate-binding protein PstS [Actinoplanes tereljensis]GIF25130.1 phosphate ABC transporter substrate-binding protein PstS [Actinoplanes tereljensis]
MSRKIRVVLAAVAVLALVFSGQVPALAAAYVPINGAGSTWSENAIRQWASNVEQYGMRINYDGVGSTSGRNQFASGLIDFGVSEIPYGKDDGAATEARPKFPFAYMPIVAGGTSFMYNLTIGKNRVTNLRLSGETLAKIFTNVITNWNDPAIKTDNPGLVLPARKIVPVVRSDGSGTTAQLTTWLVNQYPDIWNAYCAKAGRKTPCGVTSLYPVIPGSATTAQSSSTGVAGYVSQASSVGAITYVEYSYALNLHFPVAKLRNKSDYFVEPTARSVAVALLAAKINTDKNSGDYLTQDLSGVYNNTDARTYPLSSYSYMLIPVDQENTRFKVAKGKTLGDFSYYFLCEGQQQADQLGYSPLPINLVQAGLEQVRRIPGVDAQNVNIAKCNNPTFSKDGSNTLAKTAPFPQACDKVGTTQCATGTGGATANTPTTGGTKNTGGKGTTATTSPGAKPSSSVSSAATATDTSGGGAVDPDTGQAIGGGDGGGTDTATAIPVSLTSQLDPTLKTVLIVVACGLLLGLTVGPPLVARLFNRGGRP